MNPQPLPALAPVERGFYDLNTADGRKRARYRDTLPQGTAKLYALLESAPSRWHAEVIQARIEQVRHQNRLKNRRRRAAAAHAVASAEREQDRRLGRA